jgi:hypothetical protein
MQQVTRPQCEELRACFFVARGSDLSLAGVIPLLLPSRPLILFFFLCLIGSFGGNDIWKKWNGHLVGISITSCCHWEGWFCSLV